jgi:hypothetical protein
LLQKMVVFAALFTLCLAAQAPGQYAGTWASASSGSGGKLAISLTESNLASASFTLQGQETKAKPISFRKTDTDIEFVFEYSLEGTTLISKMQGSVAAKTIKGKYKSTTPDGATPVDEGTWEVALQ